MIFPAGSSKLKNICVFAGLCAVMSVVGIAIVACETFKKEKRQQDIDFITEYAVKKTAPFRKWAGMDI